MIVAAHQPGYLPGVSVIAKLARADAVVWLDDVWFTTPGFVNRNQLPDGTWLTVPVDRRDHRTPIREVTIAGGGWRFEHQRILHSRYHDCEHYDGRFAAALEGVHANAGEPLLDLNLHLTDLLLADFGLTLDQHRQSEVDAVRRGSISRRTARLVAALGGTAYLTAPNARLDRDIFAAAGVELLNFEYAGDNPSAVDPLFRTGKLPTTPRQEVNVA